MLRPLLAGLAGALAISPLAAPANADIPDYDVIREIQDLASLGDINARALGGYAAETVPGQKNAMQWDARTGRSHGATGISTPTSFYMPVGRGAAPRRAARIAGVPDARFAFHRGQGSFGVAIVSAGNPVLFTGSRGAPSGILSELLSDTTSAQRVSAGSYRLRVRQQLGPRPATVEVLFAEGLLRRVTTADGDVTLTYGPQSIPLPPRGRTVAGNRYDRAQFFVQAQEVVPLSARRVANAARQLKRPTVTKIRLKAWAKVGSNNGMGMKPRNVRDGVALVFRNQFGRVKSTVTLTQRGRVAVRDLPRG